MTIQQQIEDRFKTLAQLNKSRASELIDQICDMDPQQALARLQIEIKMESEQQVQTSKYDMGSITHRFLSFADRKKENQNEQ